MSLSLTTAASEPPSHEADAIMKDFIFYTLELIQASLSAPEQILWLAKQ